MHAALPFFVSVSCITEHRVSLVERRKNSAPITIDEVFISAGTFIVGSLARFEERPLQHVEVSHSFMMMKGEVSQQLYEQVIGTNPSFFSACPDCPVEKIRWTDATAFANALSERMGLSPCYEHSGGRWRWPDKFLCTGWRLPTEMEWEYAALGGAKQPSITEQQEIYASEDSEEIKRVPIFAGSGSVEELAWLASNSERRTHPPCQRKANGYGLCDMTGNVFEWVWDSPWTYLDQPMKDVISEEKGSHRVFRGGSWVRNIENQRIQSRRDANQRFRINDLGVRLVRTVLYEQ